MLAAAGWLARRNRDGPLLTPAAARHHRHRGRADRLRHRAGPAAPLRVRAPAALRPALSSACWQRLKARGQARIHASAVPIHASDVSLAFRMVDFARAMPSAPASPRRSSSTAVMRWNGWRRFCPRARSAWCWNRLRRAHRGRRRGASHARRRRTATPRGFLRATAAHWSSCRPTRATPPAGRLGAQPRHEAARRCGLKESRRIPMEQADRMPAVPLRSGGLAPARGCRPPSRTDKARQRVEQLPEHRAHVQAAGLRQLTVGVTWSTTCGSTWASCPSRSPPAGAARDARERRRRARRRAGRPRPACSGRCPHPRAHHVAEAALLEARHQIGEPAATRRAAPGRRACRSPPAAARPAATALAAPGRVRRSPNREDPCPPPCGDDEVKRLHCGGPRSSPPLRRVEPARGAVSARAACGAERQRRESRTARRVFLGFGRRLRGR